MPSTYLNCFTPLPVALLLLELLIMTAHLSSAKLPRYLSALELHASLASKLESAGQVRGLTSPKPHRNPNPNPKPNPN